MLADKSQHETGLNLQELRWGCPRGETSNSKAQHAERKLDSEQRGFKWSWQAEDPGELCRKRQRVEFATWFYFFKAPTGPRKLTRSGQYERSVFWLRRFEQPRNCSTLDEERQLRQPDIQSPAIAGVTDEWLFAGSELQLCDPAPTRWQWWSIIDRLLYVVPAPTRKSIEIDFWGSATIESKFRKSAK